MKLNRRTWLKGAFSLTLALPALELFGTKTLYAQGEGMPRLLVYYLPNGRRPEWWVPTGANGSLVFPEQARSLQPFADRVLSLVNLDNTAARRSPGAAHAAGTGTCMTGVHFPDLAGLKGNITLDQIVANKMSDSTRFKSLQWSAGEPGPCDVGNSPCPYTQCISWSGPGEPLIPTINPEAAFNKLFASDTEGRVGAGAEVRKVTRRSILDFVRDDARALERDLGAADKAKLDEYFTSLREVERTLLPNNAPTCEVPAIAPGGRLPYPERVAAFNELIKLAFMCNQTRVASFMIEFGLSGRSHDFINAAGTHHGLSHSAPSSTGRTRLERIETWQASQIAHMLTLLDSTADSDGGTLLDNTLVLVIPSMGAGSNHDHSRNCPMLFGGEKIIHSHGRRIAPQGESLLSNLHVSLLAAYGIEGSFGPNGMIFGDDGNAVIDGFVV